ncbi:uncharacterized protein LOC125312716 [Rhodamnia argentea]|uniref:Uncharacterized protein LOC125312716 n=1 Tax=Rhodamnia argentea TaxID=178133 RepID=A0ABM3GTW7_9MYRT|nr:uncharacterized protein LOC125312716 [Rhodamnia argentea]
MASPNLSSAFLFALLLSSLLVSPSFSELCNAQDKKVLLAIKKALNDPYILASWKSDTDCCDWYCVACDDTTHRITQLTIFDGTLEGQIPAAVGDLPYLQMIDLNRLSHVTGPIPSSLGKLKNLTFLRLSYLNLTSSIPASVGQLSKLTFVDLSHNDLTGKIPNSLTSLKNLDTFRVNDNQLCGQIPVGGKLQSVGASSYSNNKCLCGAPLPSSIKRSAAQAPVVEVRGRVETLQLPPDRDLPAKPVVAHIEDLKIRDPGNRRRNPPKDLVVAQVQSDQVDLLRALVPPEQRRGVAGKLVPRQVNVCEVGIPECCGDLTGELVVGQVQVEEDEVGEVTKESRDGAGEVIVAEGQVLEVLELKEGARDVSSDVGLLVEVDILKVREVANGGGDGAGEVATGEVEGDDAVGGGVALNVVPLAAVGGHVPGGEDVGVVEGFLDPKEGPLVVGVAELGGGGEGGEDGGGDEEGEENEVEVPHCFADDGEPRPCPPPLPPLPLHFRRPPPPRLLPALPPQGRPPPRQDLPQNAPLLSSWRPNTDCCKPATATSPVTTHRIVSLYNRWGLRPRRPHSNCHRRPCRPRGPHPPEPNGPLRRHLARHCLAQEPQIHHLHRHQPGRDHPLLSQPPQEPDVLGPILQQTHRVHPELALADPKAPVPPPRLQTGTIPKSLKLLEGNQPSLVLSDNQLSGEVPTSFQGVNFRYMDVARNMLRGDGSVFFGANKATERINLSRNRFEFDLSRVEFPKRLTGLDLSHNRIFGSIPEGIVKLELLEYLNLTYNGPWGKIPAGPSFGYESYFHNRCLCGTPLKSCK